MEKRQLGIIAAIGSLAALPLGAQAAAQAPAAAPAQSFADLLQPISNPVERLRLADEQEAQNPLLIPVQYRSHHHHHHHHNRRWYSSRGYSWYNGAWVYRPARHHHHHHHHSRY